MWNNLTAWCRQFTRIPQTEGGRDGHFTLVPVALAEVGFSKFARRDFDRKFSSAINFFFAKFRNRFPLAVSCGRPF